MKKLLLTAALLLTFSVAANAHIIGATNSKTTSNPRQSSDSPLYRPTGGSLRFSTGLPGFLTVSYNHYFLPGFMVGGGFGFGFQEGKESYYGDYIGYVAMPAFVEMDLRTPKYNWSLFLNLKVGINLFGREDKEVLYCRGNDANWSVIRYKVFLFTAAVGISYKNINLGFGYSNQHIGDFGPINFFLSYNLPLMTINKWLF